MTYDELPAPWPDLLVYEVYAQVPAWITARQDYVQASSRNAARTYVLENYPKYDILYCHPVEPPENREVVLALGGEQA